MVNITALAADPARVAVTFPYDPFLVAAVKDIPGRRWDGDHKRWTVPLASARHLSAFIERTRAEGDPAVLERIHALAKGQEQSLEASRAVTADVVIPAPAGLAYLPFQRAGIAFAAERPNTLIADEMGLGKTIQAIGVVNADPSIRNVLVICPASLKVNWKREIERWSVRPTEVVIGGGQTGEWDDIFSTDGVQWLVVNYDVIERWRAIVDAVRIDVLILDEAHYVKTRTAKRTIAVLGRWDRDPAKRVEPIRAGRRLALTGTPILNRPVELFGLVHSMAPDTFPGFRGYAIRYCDAYDGPWGFVTDGASNLDELQERLRSTIMVRRLKADVLTELPAKRRQVIELPANGAAEAVRSERDVYDRAQERIAALKAAVTKAEIEDDVDAYRKAVEALREGNRVAFDEIAIERHRVALAKVPAVIDYVRDAIEASGKVILFAWHRDVVEAIHAAFPGSVTVTGDTPLPARQEAVDAFQRDPEVHLFIGNIRAAGVGLTLTASSHVVFAELTYTPSDMTQAEDRAHRIGQRESVLVQHLVLEGSLDATMAHTLVEKQDVIDAALDAPVDTSLDTSPIASAPAPKATTLDVGGLAGGYAVENAEGNLTFLLFEAPGGDSRWDGWTFVSQQQGPNAVRIGRQRPGATYEGIWESLISKVLADPRKAMETYGKSLGRCGACGLPLTNAESRERGIGPVCAAKRGW